jgi:c-di-GMP-binding flagellar brake protein YcgR
MLTRYWDRRRYIRIPASGPARWQSGDHSGHCELLDISPGGVGLRMPARKATQLGPCITLEVEIAPGMTWRLAKDARVVRQAPEDDGMCRVGVEF